MPDFDRLKKKCSPSLFFLAISLFFLLLLLIRPRFSLHLEFRSVSGEGTLRVYQLNDDLREQNVDSQGEVLTPDTQQLKMAGYPLDLYAVRLDLYDVESLDIEALQVRLGGIPLYTYSTQWLDWMSVDPYQIELLPGDGVLTCTPTAGNFCFTILVPTALRLSMAHSLSGAARSALAGPGRPAASPHSAVFPLAGGRLAVHCRLRYVAGGGIHPRQPLTDQPALPVDELPSDFHGVRCPQFSAPALDRRWNRHALLRHLVQCRRLCAAVPFPAAAAFRPAGRRYRRRGGRQLRPHPHQRHVVHDSVAGGHHRGRVSASETRALSSPYVHQNTSAAEGRFGGGFLSALFLRLCAEPCRVPLGRSHPQCISAPGHGP